MEINIAATDIDQIAKEFDLVDELRGIEIEDTEVNILMLNRAIIEKGTKLQELEEKLYELHEEYRKELEEYTKLIQSRKDKTIHKAKLKLAV